MPPADSVSEPAPHRRRDSLAFYFQEPTTAVVRLRSSQHQVSDAQWFRGQLRQALTTAVEQAREAGYSSEDLKLTSFAVVAFIDESILSSNNPAFADWSRKTLQEELFGTNLAGEIFFDNLERLMARADSPELADVLEVYQIVLLLGFGGRYSRTNPSELQSVSSRLGSRLARIRGPLPRLSPRGLLTQERVPRGAGGGKNPYLLPAVIAALLVVLAFVAFKATLAMDTDRVRAAATQGS